MKKTLSILLLLTVVFFATAQRHHESKRGIQEEIKAKKVVYLTEAIGLTSEEAAKFWPLCNEFEGKCNKLRQKIHELHRSTNEATTDEEYEKIMEKAVEIDEQLYVLKNTYYKDLSKFLTAKKIFLYSRAEQNFKRNLINNYIKPEKK